MTINIEAVVSGITSDIEQGLDKNLIIQYWTNKIGNRQTASLETEPSSRPRARRGRPTNIEVIQSADNDNIIERMAAAAQDYSYNSIAEAMYGEGRGRAYGFKIKKWSQGLQNPTQRSIEQMRAFLVALEQGEFSDVLEAPGGNRRS